MSSFNLSILWGQGDSESHWLHLQFRQELLLQLQWLGHGQGKPMCSRSENGWQKWALHIDSLYFTIYIYIYTILYYIYIHIIIYIYMCVCVLYIYIYSMFADLTWRHGENSGSISPLGELTALESCSPLTSPSACDSRHTAVCIYLPYMASVQKWGTPKCSGLSSCSKNNWFGGIRWFDIPLECMKLSDVHNDPVCSMHPLTCVIHHHFPASHFTIWQFNMAMNMVHFVSWCACYINLGMFYSKL